MIAQRPKGQSRTSDARILPRPSTLLIALILGVLLVLGYQLFLDHYYPKIEHKGLFGDSFGGLNSLFSGLAFAGIFAALTLQAHQIRLQQQALDEQLDYAQTQNSLLIVSTYLGLSEHIPTNDVLLARSKAVLEPAVAQLLDELDLRYRSTDHTPGAFDAS